MANPPESLPFAPAEYDARLDTLREATAERGLDAVILSGPENHYYLSGYETTGFHSFPQNLIVAADGRKLMVTRQLEVENATEAAYDLAARATATRRTRALRWPPRCATWTWESAGSASR